MRSRVLVLSLLLLFPLLAQSGASQPQQESLQTPLSSVELKNLAPVSKDILKVRLPRAKEATLSNGLTVLIIENNRLPLVSIQYNISAAGPIFEPANAVGLANVTAQMMRLGTKSRNATQWRKSYLLSLG